MLRTLSIKNFRLLRDITINVEPGVPTFLIGPNSSGKSSVLQVLDLLGRAAREGSKEAFSAYEKGGGFATANSANPYADPVETVIETTHMLDPYERTWAQQSLMRHRIELWNEHLGSERLTVEPPLSLLFQRDGRTITVKNASSGAEDKTQVESDSRLSFELLKQRSFYPWLDDLRSELASIHLYDGFLTTPAWARSAREGQLSPFDSATLSPMPRIDRRGLGLVNSLYDLQANHPDVWDELLEAFRAEFPFVTRLEFPADPAGGRIALAFRERRFSGVRMQGYQMSEGMASYLCLLAAILSPAPAAALAFDEPDIHLHPSALRRVVHLIEKASAKSAIFVATHSDRMLDFLTDPAASLRVCEPTNDGVKITQLDRASLDEWRADYAVSELRQRGHLDGSNGTGSAS